MHVEAPLFPPSAACINSRPCPQLHCLQHLSHTSPVRTHIFCLCMEVPPLPHEPPLLWMHWGRVTKGPLQYQTTLRTPLNTHITIFPPQASQAINVAGSPSAASAGQAELRAKLRALSAALGSGLQSSRGSVTSQ